ncbi:MAG: flavin reductase family protein [Planctomycetia bacterium]|nr:flavin reductase family protein [Planctomycetia bacterium]
MNASEALERKYPEPIGLAVTIDSRGVANIIPLGWVIQTSFVPLMFAISIGHPRYSHKLLSECREFVLALPSEEQAEAMWFCGSHSGRDTDKFAESGFEPVPATKVKPPLIKGACANFECKLTASLETGDHTIFVGEVVAAHVEPDAPGRLYTLSPGVCEFGGVRPVRKLGV